MKKLVKVLSLVLVFVLVLAPVVSFADDVGGDVPFDAKAGDTTALIGLTGVVETVIGVIQWVGYAVAIVMILWLGIQYMTVQPGKKAELKVKMWTMAIGIALLVGGVSVLKIIWKVSQTATSGMN